MNLKKLQQDCKKKCQPVMIWNSVIVYYDILEKQWKRRIMQGQYIRAIDGPIGSDRRAAA